MKLQLLLFSLSIFFLSTLVSTSQKLDNPLDPINVRPHDQELGAFIGLGANFTTGKYLPECPTCEFEKPSKFGYTLGLKYDYDIEPYFYVGVEALFNDLGLKGSFRRTEPVPLTRSDNTEITVPLEFRHTLDISNLSLTLVPNVFFRIDEWLDLRLGVFGDFSVSNTIVHTKELLTKTATLPDGEVVKASLPDGNGNKQELENHSIPGYNSFSYGLFPQINTNIELSDDADLLLGAFFMLPFSKYSSLQTDFSQMNWRIMIGLSFNLIDIKHKDK